MTLGNALTAALRAQAESASKPHVLLIYDLHGASPAVYARLDVELRTLQYTKVVEDTTWEGRYNAAVSLDDALATTKAEFERSARKAGATSYNLRVYGSATNMKIVNASA